MLHTETNLVNGIKMSVQQGSAGVWTASLEWLTINSCLGGDKNRIKLANTVQQNSNIIHTLAHNS